MKMNGFPTLRTAMVLPFLLAAGLGANSASADRFRLHDVRGDYVFAFDGTAAGMPVAAVGRYYSDGNGNLLAGERTIAIGDGSFAQTFTCTYTVDADGTGTATCALATGQIETFAFVLYKNGREAYLVGTTPGIVVRGQSTRQR